MSGTTLWGFSNLCCLLVYGHIVQVCLIDDLAEQQQFTIMIHVCNGGLMEGDLASESKGPGFDPHK